MYLILFVIGLDTTFDNRADVFISRFHYADTYESAEECEQHKTKLAADFFNDARKEFSTNPHEKFKYIISKCQKINKNLTNKKSIRRLS